MTTEEKARAYDEALTTAKRIISENCSEVEKLCLKCVFPELAESEDERITDTIFNCLYQCCDTGFISGTQRDNALAYLEKQKVKEKQDRMMPVYNDRDSFESALEKAWKSYNESGARTVDGCEDDYVECAHAKGFREGYLFGIEKQKECHSDDVLNSTYQEGFEDGFKAGREVERRNSSDNDFIKPRMQEPWNKEKQKEQKPAEWSKEDEKMYKAIIIALSLNSATSYLRSWGITLEDADSWLNSLRPSWKPSEGQDYSGLSDLERGIHRGFLCAGVENVPVTIIKETAKECLELAKKELLSYADESNPAIEAMADLERAVTCGNVDNIPKWLVEELDKAFKKGQESSHEDYLKGYTNGYKDAEQWYNDWVAARSPIMPATPSGWGCDGKHCINPHHDCINCPVRYSSGGTITTPNTASGTSTATLHGNTSATDGNEHNPSFMD